jgi:hypothetical protein
LFSALSGPFGPTLGAPNTAGGGVLPLLYEANVTGAGRYLGAFRVPAAAGANPLNWSGSSGASGGRAVWYKPEGNAGSGSLIISGRDVGTNQGYLSEISIPTTLNTTGVVASMPRGSFLTPDPYFFDISGSPGNQQAIAPTDGNGIVTCGVFTYDGNLYQNFKAFYQDLTEYSYFKRTGTSVNGGSVSGPFRFNNQSFDGITLRPGWYTGPVCSVPTSWQGFLGGVMLQGNWQMSNPEPQGNGPFMASFNPNNIGVTPAANNILLGYTTAHPLSTSANCATSDWQRSIDYVSGMAFPTGSRTVLVIGRHGLGIRQYGTPGEVDETGCGIVIYDPVSGDKGWHAYPYKYTVWAYDANDLLDVKNGVKLPYQVTPYSTWNITFPGQDPDSTNVANCAACFDSVSNRLFFIERESPRCQAILEPIIHVFQVTV